MSADGYKLLVEALNARHPGWAVYVDWPRTDHGLYTHTSLHKAFERDPERGYDPKLSEYVLNWLGAY